MMKQLAFSIVTACGLVGCGDAAVPALVQSHVLDHSTDIRGPDANNNEVRDDIEAWINSQPYTDGQRRVAMQAARAIQRTLLVDLTDRAALERSHDEIAAAAECVNSDPVTENLILRIEAITANTRERAKRYVQYSRASSGSVIKLPDSPVC